MEIKEINGYKIAMPQKGVVQTLDDLIKLKEFAADPINGCDGFYAEGTNGNVYDYVNGSAVALGEKGSVPFVLNESGISPHGKFATHESKNEAMVERAASQAAEQKLKEINEQLIEQDRKNNAEITALRTKLFDLENELRVLRHQVKL